MTVLLWIVAILGIIAVIIALDALIGRSCLQSILEHEFAEGGHGRILIVNCIGILADPVDATKAVADKAWLSHADVLHIGYGGDIFRSKWIITWLVERLRQVLADHQYDVVILVGSSMGAFVGMDALLELHRSAGVLPDRTSVVLVDPPSGSKDMLAGGKFIVPILQVLPFGPVCNFLLKGVMHRMLVPPKDEYIQPDLDKAEVKRQALASMQRYSLSIWRDELVFMHQHRAYMPKEFAWLESIIYLQCDNGNETVAQPQAANTWVRWTGGRARVELVPGPHCSYAQLPSLWINTFNKVLWG